MTMGMDTDSVVSVGGGAPDRAARQRLRAVATVTTLTEDREQVGTTVMDETSTIVRCDDAFCAITGFGVLELVGRRGLDLIHPQDQTFAMEAWMMMLEQPGQQRPLRLRHRTASDGWLWVEFVNHLADDGSVRCEISDLTERIEEREAAAHSERVLRQLGDALPLGVFQLDDRRRITYSNDRLSDLLENNVVESLDALLQLVVDEDRPRLDRLIDATFASGRDGDLEIRIDPRIGCHRICALSVRPVADDQSRVGAAICCLTDVTEQVTQRDEQRRRNDVDPLTGALNRRAAVDALQEMLDAGLGAAVVFVDIDGFTRFNEGHGHGVGDDILCEVARRLHTTICEEDVVGRYGGDEFIIVANCEAALGDADEIGRRISQVMHRPVTLPSGCFDLTASIGIASTDGSIAGAERLIARAGSAMYEAKEQAGDAHVVWRDPVDPSTRSR